MTATTFWIGQRESLKLAGSQLVLGSPILPLANPPPLISRARNEAWAGCLAGDGLQDLPPIPLC